MSETLVLFAVVLILIAFLLRGQETDLGELHCLIVIQTGLKDTKAR